MSTGDRRKKIDFFISYIQPDHAWAEWIAYTLEAEGYSTILQAWDFRPGSNFVTEMNEAIKRSKRTIAVLSRNYTKSGFAQAEWISAFAKDPAGHKGLLVPVRVEAFDVEGLLRTIVYIDLIGLSEESARQVLLRGLSSERKAQLSPRYPIGPDTHEKNRFGFPVFDVQPSTIEEIVAHIRNSTDALPPSIDKTAKFLLDRIARRRSAADKKHAESELFALKDVCLNLQYLDTAPRAYGQFWKEALERRAEGRSTDAATWVRLTSLAKSAGDRIGQLEEIVRETIWTPPLSFAGLLSALARKREGFVYISQAKAPKTKSEWVKVADIEQSLHELRRYVGRSSGNVTRALRMIENEETIDDYYRYSEAIEQVFLGAFNDATILALSVIDITARNALLVRIVREASKKGDIECAIAALRQITDANRRDETLIDCAISWALKNGADEATLFELGEEAQSELTRSEWLIAMAEYELRNGQARKAKDFVRESFNITANTNEFHWRGGMFEKIAKMQARIHEYSGMLTTISRRFPRDSTGPMSSYFDRERKMLIDRIISDLSPAERKAMRAGLKKVAESEEREEFEARLN